VTLVECPECGEEYPPVATHWICPACGIDDRAQPKMAVFEVRDYGDN
jgi:Zn finger protein HypA/HybF involved in hydrogenase expression